MKVTVQETIEHSRDITAEMVVAYALRHGWNEEWVGQSTASYRRSGAWAIVVPLPNRILGDYRLETSVMTIARATGRKPHEVLADIAEGR